jgi:D-alanyl-D-alanine carboxypeptidase/D-alanyl-D-alanine-endopeptidase (penicillin-binding protein 4)
MAETIFKLLGATGSEPATWERAALATKEALVALGVAADGFEIINGSGLYDGTKVAPDAMTMLLTAETRDTADAKSFRDSLAVAGVSGTLKGRLKPLKSKVSGKTGTLDNATSLSGYVPTKGCLLAFAVIVNGDLGGRAAAVNRRIDSFVLDLAKL